MSVYKKLQEARIELQSKPLKKSGKNNFAGYQYFELGDFLPTIQQICLDKGLCGTISYGKEIATLTIRDTDKPDYVVEFTCPMSTAALKGCHEVQNMGAVLTYIRRYLWVSAFEILEHDALDATTGKDEPKKAKPTVESPRIVGERTQWQEDPSGWIIDAPADPLGQDVQGWLELIKNSTYLFLGMCNTTDDVLSIFKKNKTLFDTVKLTDPQFFTEMMTKFTEVKTKLEKEAV
jgi:hypothetical protein